MKFPQVNCPCGNPRNLNVVELLCANCYVWYHETCVVLQPPMKLLPFLFNYYFFCKNCSKNGREIFKKLPGKIPQMCLTAIANLQQISVRDGMNRMLFDKEKEIIPFIEEHWETLTTTSRRLNKMWHVTIQKTLFQGVHDLFSFHNSEDGQMYGLIDTDLTTIMPNYWSMIKYNVLQFTDIGIEPVSVAGRVRSRNKKRKFAGELNSTGKKRRNVDIAKAKSLSHGYPLDHPFNNDGYRYLLAEPDPHASFRYQEFDDNSAYARKPMPGWLYRTVIPSTILLALHDRARQLKVSEDRLTVTGKKGYSTIRATHYVTKGVWYWEATIDEMPEGSATRIGWGQDYANLQAPLGYDKFGYSWRSKKGTKFHESHGKHYSPGYGEGDTVGFMIVLPQNSSTKLVPNTYKDKPLVKFKGHLYYEEKNNLQGRLKTLKCLPGSKILHFKNGECQGIAFKDIYQGCYYPTISLHRNVTVTANFGPNFKYPPSSQYNWRGMHEKAEEAIGEHIMADIIYLLENDGKLGLDSSSF